MNNIALVVPEAMNSKQAWNLAQLIQDAETDVRLAKGKFWNRCEHGTRQEICEHFGWEKHTMKQYGTFATEMVKMSSTDSISYSHWNNSRKAGITSEQRPAFLTTAAKEDWTPKTVTAEAIKITGKVTPPTITLAGKSKESLDENRRKPSVVAPGKMHALDAKQIFGLAPLSIKTITIIYKALSKEMHPDMGGSDEGMAKLNEAYEVLKGQRYE